MTYEARYGKPININDLVVIEIGQREYVTGVVTGITGHSINLEKSYYSQPDGEIYIYGGNESFLGDYNVLKSDILYTCEPLQNKEMLLRKAAYYKVLQSKFPMVEKKYLLETINELEKTEYI